jgi:hypothetical protein
MSAFENPQRHRDPSGFVTHAEFDARFERLYEHLANLNERLDSFMEASGQAQVTTQADVDALTTQVGQIASDLQSARTSLQTEIYSLAAANPQIDLTGLRNALAPLDAQVTAIGQLQATAGTSTPPPPPTAPAGGGTAPAPAPGAPGAPAPTPPAPPAT